MTKVWTSSLVLVPILTGYLVSHSLGGLAQGEPHWIFRLWAAAPLPWAVLFLAFWFWVGRRFAAARFRPITGLVLGNSLTVASLILYVYQFYLLGDAERSAGVAALAQYYHLVATPFGAWIMSAVASLGATTTLSGGSINLLAYGLMLTLFTVGFSVARRGMRKSQA